MIKNTIQTRTMPKHLAKIRGKAKKLNTKKGIKGPKPKKGLQQYFGRDGAEIKFKDSSVSDSITPDGAIHVIGSYNLSANETPVTMAQGAGDEERIGRKIKALQLQLRLRMYANSYLTSDSFNSADIYHTLDVWLDKQANGADPQITDIYSNITSGSLLQNLSTEKRFIKLASFEHVIERPKFEADTKYRDSRSWFINKDIPINKVIEYSAGTNNVSELTSNNIVITHGGYALVRDASDLVVANGNVRLLYTDV